MQGHRIDIADPSPEGDAVADALARRGFEITRVDCAALAKGSRAELVILAGDAPGAVHALRALRSTEDVSLDVPIVLVGAFPDMELDTERALDMGADAFYQRPVPIERLVRKVETFVAPAGPRLSVPTRGAEPVSQLLRLKPSEVSEVVRVPQVTRVPPESSVPPPPRLPERTMELAPSDPLATLETRAPFPREDDISPVLARVLLSADRRVFPASPPLEFRFRTTHDAPELLVPAELLEPAAALDVDDDALDNFTFVGGGTRDNFVLPALTPGAGSHSSSFAAPPGLPTTGSERLRADDASADAAGDARPGSAVTGESSVSPIAPTPSSPSSKRSAPPQVSVRGDSVMPVEPLPFGEPTGRGQGRQGELGEAELLALVAHVVERRLDVELALDFADAGSLTLVIVEGALEQLRGPIARLALADLATAFRLQRGGGTPDEAAALAQLERFVAAGHLSRFDVDAAVARATERVLHDAATARSGRYVLEPLDPAAVERLRAPAALLRVPLLEVLVEGLRRRIGSRDLPRLVGSGPHLLTLVPSAMLRLGALRVEPEVVSLLARHDGAPVDALLLGAHPSIGIAGLVFALSKLGIVVLRSGAARVSGVAEVVAAIRDTLGRSVELARDADYFAVLGVPRDATPREIEAAWRIRRADLERLPVATYGLHDLEPDRELALEVLDEAREMLLQDSLREPYRAALEGM